jgi:molybdate transport repressor ModE-like protein
MDLKLKIYITGTQGRKCMGYGPMRLLQEIDGSGSIRKAAAGMSISYAKAHEMLNRLENELGTALLERRKGGDKRLGTVLTPEGRRFVEEYSRFQHDIKQYADKRFREFQKEAGVMREVRPEQKHTDNG